MQLHSIFHRFYGSFCVSVCKHQHFQMFMSFVLHSNSPNGLCRKHKFVRRVGFVLFCAYNDENFFIGSF
ncbi:hypothetical protein D3C80_1200670 [compost metagenome]